MFAGYFFSQLTLNIRCKETFNKKDRDRIIVGFGFWAGFGTILGIALTTVLERELAYYVAATAFIATIIMNVLR